MLLPEITIHGRTPANWTKTIGQQWLRRERLKYIITEHDGAWRPGDHLGKPREVCVHSDNFGDMRLVYTTTRCEVFGGRAGLFALHRVFKIGCKILSVRMDSLLTKARK